MKNRAPLEIGVTGGIGSGKSVICKIFSLMGIPIYDADKRAKWLNNNDQDLKAAISGQFGEQAYNEKGLDRDFIAKIVFENPEKLRALNAIVHPAVAKDYTSWVNNHPSAPYLIKEAALMFESGSAGRLEKVINVSAPEDLRIRRVLKRDPFRSEKEIRSIIDKQMPESERLKRSDYIIYNDGSQMVIPQVLKLHREFMTLWP